MALTRPIIALVDHERESTEFLLREFSKLHRNRDRKKLTEAFEFITVIVDPKPDVALRAFEGLRSGCPRQPDLVLVDLAFGDDVADAAVFVGRDLAAELRRTLTPTPVGVYTKHDLSFFHLAQLTSEGLAVVFMEIFKSHSAQTPMTGDQWSDLFDKIILKETSTPPTSVNREASIPTSTSRVPSDASEKVTELTAEQILTAMRPDGTRGLFVLGCFEKRITFYSQQCRALTLVRALFDGAELRPGDKVGIIGGGPAGLTAAMAAVKKGCNVDLYESMDSVLSLQSESGHRYLHPHIYEWPDQGSMDDDARLPLLNWRAGYASAIAEDLQIECAAFRRAHASHFRIITRASITEIRYLTTTSGRIKVVGNHGDIDESFDVVIVAIGFGLDDSTHAGIKTVSYWSPDSVQGHHSGRKRRMLISGAGDGGLTDIGRAALIQFRHHSIIQEFSELDDLGRQMQIIDKDVRQRKARGEDGINLYKEYERINVNVSLIEKFSSLKRTDREVFLNFREPGVFSLDSALINRLLTWLLLKAGVVERRLGAIRPEYISSAHEGRIRIAFGGKNDDSGESDFDDIIFRHGTKRGFFEATFPELAEACRGLGGKVSELGLTGSLSPETRRWYGAS